MALAIAASAPWVCRAQTVTFDDAVPDFPGSSYQHATVAASFQDLAAARFQVIADPLCTGECFAPADFSLDNVSLEAVAAVPEPSTVALMVLPLAILAALARRRRRSEPQKM